jgi:hypothetical protein
MYAKGARRKPQEKAITRNPTKKINKKKDIYNKKGGGAAES